MFFHANGLLQQRRLAAQAAPTANLFEFSQQVTPAQPALLRSGAERRWFGQEESRVFRMAKREKTFLRGRFSAPGIA